MSDVLINPISPLQQLENLQKASPKTDSGDPDKFQKLLGDALQEVDGLSDASDAKISQVLTGEVKDVHTAMVALQQADLSFQMIMQVRNKLVEAYQEMMRMQV